MAIVDTAPLRAATSCPTSRLVDEREAISSSFAVILLMVVKSHLPPVREQRKRQSPTVSTRDREVHRRGFSSHGSVKCCRSRSSERRGFSIDGANLRSSQVGASLLSAAANSRDLSRARSSRFMSSSGS